MSFSTKTTDVGIIAGAEHGLERLIVRVQAVAADDIGHLHRHDNADQILCVLEGELLIEVDGESKVCRPGELGIAPAGTAHGFLGLGAPALLEVFGEQQSGTVFLLPGGEEVEVQSPRGPVGSARPGDRHVHAGAASSGSAATVARLIARECRPQRSQAYALRRRAQWCDAVPPSACR